MQIDIAQGWSPEEILVGACKRKEGLSAQNASLYYRAITEGGCKTLQDSRRWVDLNRPTPKRKTTEEQTDVATKKKNTVGMRRTFGQDDFELMMLRYDYGYDDESILDAFNDSGLTRDNVKKHLRIFKIHQDTTYEEHREHYRAHQMGVAVDTFEKSAPQVGDKDIVDMLLNRIHDESFQGLLRNSGIQITIRRERVEVYYETYGSETK